MVELRGLRVLVTRPGQRGEALGRAIREAGGSAVLFPALEIVGIGDSDALQALAEAFPAEPLTVFISPNAATFGRAWLETCGLWETVAANRVAAVGSGTGQVLRQFGIASPLAPTTGSGAEALLDLPELAVLHDTQVVLFRGVGGQENLARQLTARGALVHYAEVYRRVRPAARLTAERLAGVDIVATSSREGLENLYALAAGEAGELLRRLPLLVSSAEAARSAHAHGQRISPIISPQVSNEQILEELARWRKRTNRKAAPRKTAN
jgi:uroporphyrinogen-III synthase